MALYRWPATAAVGRPVPKERLYAAASVGGDLRRRFVAEVQRITWAYKLGEESLRLSGDDAVPEIQVFTVELKADALSDQVLLAVDKAIPSPILFEVHRPGTPLEIRLSAANKTPSSCTGGRSQTSDGLLLGLTRGPSEISSTRSPDAMSASGHCCAC